MCQILSENITISNDLFHCFTNKKKCNIETYNCFKNKLKQILNELRSQLLVDMIDDEVNEIFQAVNDVYREILKYDTLCNKHYDKLVNLYTDTLNQLTFK